MKISFITITTQQNYPYIERPDLNIFEPTIESLKAQTMDKSEFEWVIVDYLYEERKDYFKNVDLPFHVKHVPASPNIWHDIYMSGTCTQYNKGIIYADGELLYFGSEGYIFIPEFCERLWNYYKQGYVPLVWYIIDDTFIPTQNLMQCINDVSKKLTLANNGILGISYNISSYNGKEIFIEHRPITAFKENNNIIYNAPWEWWYGCSSASLNSMLKINGFDQRFDGDKMLLDSDVGSRLQLAGFRNGLFRDLFIIRLRNNRFTWEPLLKRETPTIKCNLGLIWLSRHLKEFRANSRKITDKDIKWIKEVYCAVHCVNGKNCRTNHPWQYPFEHKEGYVGHFTCEKRLYEFWKNNQTIINLTEERNKRIAGDEKYKEGTYI